MLLLFKQALRQILRSPGFSATAILLLGLGIGLGASIFSLTNAVLFRPLPLPEGERLVRILRTAPDGVWPLHSPANYLDLRVMTQSLEQVAARIPETVAVAEPGQLPEPMEGLSVSLNFLPVLRIQPMLGRGFIPSDGEPGSGPGSLLLTHRCWKSRYQGDPAVLGRILRIDSQDYTVIGILPPSLDEVPMWRRVGFVRPQVIWPNFHTLRSARWFDLVGRLKPGVSLASAEAELATIAARLAQDHPTENAGHGFLSVPLASSHVSPRTRLSLWLGNGLAALVLVIACANLASVQIARALGRSHEFAVRAALGAHRRALMAPLVLESVLLALAGGAAGLLIAALGNRLLVVLHPSVVSLPLDLRVIAFAFTAALLSTVGFGLAPAWLATRVTASDALKDGSRSNTAGRGHGRIKAFLIVTQFALAFVLVSTAISFTVAIRRALERELGWQYQGLFTGFFPAPFGPFPTDVAQRRLADQLRERLQNLPGVTDVALSHWLPLSHYGIDKVFIEGIAAPPPGQEPLVSTNAVDPGYFALLQIPLREGRHFSAALQPESPPVVIINQSMASRLWPQESAIGKRVRHGEDMPWAEVIGVVGDVHMAINFDLPSTRWQVYWPLELKPDWPFSIAIRSTVPGSTLVMPVRREIAALHQDIIPRALGPTESYLNASLAGNTFTIATLGTFAGLGLVTALVGLYGLISQLVLQQQRELGVRLALGAAPAHLLQLVMGQGIRLLATGIAFGLLGTYVFLRLFQQTIPALPLPNPLLQALITALLLGVGLGACFLPARRATRIDPVIVLRST